MDQVEGNGRSGEDGQVPDRLGGSRTYRDGARAVAPLAIAVGGFGISFGVLARGAGMGIVAPIVMSATTFAGSAQFAAISILGAGGTVATAVTAAVLLNARYGPIGLSVAPSLRGGPVSRFLHAQLVVDESWAVASEGGGRWDPRVLVGAGMALYVAWVTGTALGVAFGDVLGDPASWGLDAAFPALFLALLVPQLRSRSSWSAAVVGGVIALSLTPFTPAGVPIVCASVGCVVGLVGRRRVKEEPT
jgi:4-azaleucine resistance transporter AzlC